MSPTKQDQMIWRALLYDTQATDTTASVGWRLFRHTGISVRGRVWFV